MFDLGHLRFARQLDRRKTDRGAGAAANLSRHPLERGRGCRDNIGDRQSASRNVNWVGFWIFRAEVPMVAQAALFGGNVQVGLEGNLFLELTVLTSNGQLVERAVQII